MFKVCALAVCAWLATVPAARAEVQLSLGNGRVTILAKDATVRQILAEWARVGKTRIINAERVPGGPITLELKDVYETEALDVLLRTLSGYLAAPRTELTPNASVFDSIVVMPTIAVAAPRTGAPASSPAPFSPPPTFANQEEDQDPNAPGRSPGAPQQPVARPPIFSTFPAPQNGNTNTGARPTLPTVRPGQASPPPPTGEQPFVQPVPQQAPPPAPPTSPGVIPNPAGGVSAPGMIAAPPSQPGQPQRPPN